MNEDVPVPLASPLPTFPSPHILDRVLKPNGDEQPPQTLVAQCETTSQIPRPETPDQDDIFNTDEPSSALADRILSAPHNSSPPPSVLSSRRRSFSRQLPSPFLDLQTPSRNLEPSLPPNSRLSPAFPDDPFASDHETGRSASNLNSHEAAGRAFPRETPAECTPSPLPRTRSREHSPNTGNRRVRGSSIDPSPKRTVMSFSPDSATTLDSLATLLPSVRGSPRRDPFPLPSMPFTTMGSPTRVPASPMRLASPTRFTNVTSDARASPAKRIKVQDAVACGRISPAKGAQLLGTNLGGSRATPSRDGNNKTPVFQIKSNESPTRRVLQAQPMIRPQPLPPCSPRSPQKTRGGSVEPQHSLKSSVPPRRHASEEPVHSFPRPSPSKQSATHGLNKRPLPFPLHPSTLPSSIAEEQPSGSALPSSPLMSKKSLLKQTTQSRIPRMASKPYTRPSGSRQITKLVALQSQTKTAATGPQDGMNFTAGSASTTPASPVKPGQSSPLKRRRDPDQSAAMLGASLSTLPPAQQRSPLLTPPSDSDLALPVIVSGQIETAPTAPPIPVPVAKDSGSTNQELSPIPQKDTPSTSLLSPPQENVDVPSGTSQGESFEPLALRRTSRVRKPVVVQTPAPPPPRVNQPRRRVPAASNPQMIRSATDPFSQMSAVALRSLTSDNTFRNQQYLAAKLETEIVRKGGLRPESPPMKVKTIVQKEEEAQIRRRKERVARRGRGRDQDASPDACEEGQEYEENGLTSIPASYPSYRRGAGDEEDYETPVRPARPHKRRRTNDIENGPPNEHERKRVAWSQDLFSFVTLEDVKPGTRSRTQAQPNSKGCLAPVAGRVQLDSLGNHAMAETNPPGLVEEVIVVKKFIYDNDPENVLPPVIVPPPSGKSTRPRGKKSKS